MNKFWSKAKHHWKTTRHWLKEDKSVWSWLVNLLIAFIIIKFIIYPGLGLVFGSSLPVVAVVSSSMDHNAIQGVVCGKQMPADYNSNLDGYWKQCGQWYADRNITEEQFKQYMFSNGFQKGDIMVLWGRGTIHQGDIVVYEAAEQYPIIHRVISINSSTLTTKGDHNPIQIQQYVLMKGNVAYQCVFQGQPSPCIFGGQYVAKETPGAVALLDETNVSRDKVIGKAVLDIPWLGWVKIWFTDLVQWVLGLFH